MSDNTISTAQNLGFLSNQTVTETGFVGVSDAEDFYRFSIYGDLELSLTNISPNSDVDVRIIRDSNGNGQVDAGEEIVRSQNYSNQDESIDLLGLSGQYLVHVYQYSGNSNYTLSLSAGRMGDFGEPAEPNDSLTQAYDLNTLNGNRNFAGHVDVNSDYSDYYKFTLGAESNFGLVLTHLTGDADVRIVKDNFSDGIEYVGGSYGTTNRETISLSGLESGDYYVQVYAYSGATDYNLYLRAQPEA